MSKLLKYFRGYRRDGMIAPFMKLLEALLELAIPLIVAAIIDAISAANGGSGGDSDGTTYILRLCGLMALCGTVGMLFSITSQYFSARAAVGFSSAVRRDLYRHVLSLPREESDACGASALLTRLTADVDRLQNGVNLGLRLLLRSPFIVFGSVIMAFVTDVRIGWIFLATLPVLSAVIFTVILRGIPLFSRVGSKLDVLTRRTRDNLRGVRVIRAHRHEDAQTAQFDEENSALTRASLTAGRFSSVLNPMTYVIVNVAIILIIRSGAPAVDTGRLTQGQVIALYNYMAQILTELVKLANLIVTLTKAAACAGRISATLSLPTEETSDNNATVAAPAADTPVLEFKNASFRYRGASGDALAPLSFRLYAGQTLGVIGGTGSGKTTLSELIPRFYDATEGEILVDGVNVRDYPVGQLRGKCAVVPQSARLFSGSIADNLRWGKPDATPEEMTDALRSAGAFDFIDKREGGLDADVSAGGTNFSGGQRQRLTIARAIIRKPRILILDDSFSALDYSTDLAVRSGIASLTPRPATVIISQRPSSVMGADLIIVLDDGHAVGIGTHRQLLDTCPTYREIYSSQYGGDENENE